jgi:hypothetical protein
MQVFGRFVLGLLVPGVVGRYAADTCLCWLRVTGYRTRYIRVFRKRVYTGKGGGDKF